MPQERLAPALGMLWAACSLPTASFVHPQVHKASVPSHTGTAQRWRELWGGQVGPALQEGVASPDPAPVREGLKHARRGQAGPTGNSVTSVLPAEVRQGGERPPQGWRSRAGPRAKRPQPDLGQQASDPTESGLLTKDSAEGLKSPAGTEHSLSSGHRSRTIQV